jgi:hypothetical protein
LIVTIKVIPFRRQNAISDRINKLLIFAAKLSSAIAADSGTAARRFEPPLMRVTVWERPTGWAQWGGRMKRRSLEIAPGIKIVVSKTLL